MNSGKIIWREVSTAALLEPYYMDVARNMEWTREHLVVSLPNGESFIWCPLGQTKSFHPEDVKQKYCSWCHMSFGEINKESEP